MKTFTQWVEANKLDLPQVDNAETNTTAESGGAGRRYRFGHPDAEAASQYPLAHFAARMPDAFLQFQWRKQQKMKAPPDNAP